MNKKVKRFFKGERVLLSGAVCTVIWDLKTEGVLVYTPDFTAHTLENGRDLAPIHPRTGRQSRVDREKNYSIAP